MECYGKQYRKLEQCRNCSLSKYCSQAADPPLLTDNAPPPLVNQTILAYGQPSRASRFEAMEQDRRYTRADLLEVIGFMASLDPTSLELIDQKLADPTLNLSKLALRRGVSRQAMHKMITRRLKSIPELEAVLTYRKHRKNGGGNSAGTGN